MRNILTILFGLVALTKAVITDDPICDCTTCCYIDDSATVDFTGKTIVQTTYPDVSLSGNYTVINYQSKDGTNTSLPYQYVVKYENGFKTKFDRNVFIFTENGNNLNCSQSHLYYGDPESTKYTQIEMVEVEQDGSSFCTLDINGILSRDEIADDSDIFFAFNQLVDERAGFNIMYDLSDSGVILPEEDIIIFPYIIQGGSVTATDINNVTEFYIDVGLNVSNIDTTQDGIDPACLSIDELFHNGNAYWWVPDGPNCNVTVISGGEGDAVTEGREYHLKLSQFEYETCSLATRESNGQLHFDFRLVLPTDDEETNENDPETCGYFSSPLNVQNITVSMDQDVTDTVTSDYITDFNPVVTSVYPEKCTDYETYPTPHAVMKISINATFPSVNAVDYNTIGIPTFGEQWEFNNLLWDDNGDGSSPQYSCTSYPNPDGDAGTTADAYTECEFKFISSVCEPMYVTTDDECALERNTTRFIYDFTIEQTIVGGQKAIYNSGAINSGVDNMEWDKDFCVAEGERDVVNVNDLFNVNLELRNYYYGDSVDWDNTTLLTMKDDMIARFRVGVTADTPFEFSDDLSLIIKTVMVTLRNPITEEEITSYVFSATDKAGFMDFSWSPYYQDPRFCSWYDSAGGNDKCGDFFVDGVRSNGYHDATWIENVMPLECQVNDTLPGDEDTNNSDFFLFTPREWFRDNTAGFVEMSLQVTGIVHKCTDEVRLLSEAKNVRGRDLQSTSDILYVSDEIIVTFVTDDEGNEHVEVSKPTNESWVEENMALVVTSGVVAGIILIALIILCFQNKRLSESMHIPIAFSASKPDF